jgi:hypothetical protein
MEKKITIKTLAEHDGGNKRALIDVGKIQPFVKVPIYHSSDLLSSLLKLAENTSLGLKIWSQVFTVDGCMAKVEYLGKVYTVSVERVPEVQ